MEDFWVSCLKRFEQDLPAQQFNTWIKPLRFERRGDEDFRLVAPNRFVLQWIKEKYLSQIEESSRAFFSAPISIALHLSDIRAEKAPTTPGISARATPPLAAAPIKPREPASNNAPPSRYTSSRLSAGFTFDSFVTGKANQLAKAAALQVSEHPGTSYNPLFVYGGVGLGKTHLVQAIGNYVFEQNPDVVIRYTHAEDYIADVVRAYQQKSFDTFKRYYRSLDLLIIDDIQFLNGKNRTQEEFFFAFNALIEAKKQIIITCDTYPKEMEGIEDRLISRFDWGLTVAIEPPELEMRVAILLKKAVEENINISEETAFFIAKHLRSNVRELEGALNKVLAYSKFTGKDVTLDLTKDALKDVLSVNSRQVSVENIQKTVADYYKIKVAEMYSKKRSRNLARPRQIAMYLAKELTQLSLPDIGGNFGGRDHTTVLHACRKVVELREKFPEINHDLHVLLQVLKG